MNIKDNDIEMLTGLHRDLLQAAGNKNWDYVQAVLGEAIDALPEFMGAPKIVLVVLKGVKHESQIADLYQTLSDKFAQAMQQYRDMEKERDMRRLRKISPEEKGEYQALLDAEARYNTDSDLEYFDDVHYMMEHWVDAEKWSNIRDLLTHYTRQDNPNRGTLRTILMVLKPLRHLEEVKEEYQLAAEKLREGNPKGLI
jgi:hypothetical protein